MDYFFKCTVKSISYEHGDTYEVSVRPFAEYSVKSGDKVYVAFMPKDEMQNGLLLKCDDVITIKKVENSFCLSTRSHNCTVYVKDLGTNNSKMTIELGGKIYSVTKVVVEV